MWADGEVDWALAEALAYGSLLLEGTDIRIAGPGHPPGHVQPAPRRARRPHERRRVRAAGPPRARAGQVLDLRLAAVGVRRPRLRVRLLGGGEGRAGGLGGAVRRLLERRVHHRRPVHRGRRGQVEPDVRASCCSCPHGYEGQGPEHSSARVERFLTLCAEDNIQVANVHAGRRRYFHLLRRQVRRDGAQAAGACSRRSRCCGPSRPARRSTSSSSGSFQRDARRRRRRRTRAPIAADRAVAPGKVGHEAHRGPRRGRRARSPSCGSSSSTRGPTTQLDEIVAALPQRHASSSGSRRSRRTWAPGTS